MKNSTQRKGNDRNNNKLSGLVASSAIVNVDIDANGKVPYDAIVKQCTNSDDQVSYIA